MSKRAKHTPTETLAQIWYADGTRWAELLLASVKLALGLGILLSLGSPTILLRYGAVWPPVGFALGLCSLVVCALQVVGVLWQFYSMRQAALLLGLFMWGFYGGITLLLGSPPQVTFIYVPFIVTNGIIARKLVLSQRVAAAARGNSA